MLSLTKNLEDNILKGSEKRQDAVMDTDRNHGKKRSRNEIFKQDGTEVWKICHPESVCLHYRTVCGRLSDVISDAPDAELSGSGALLYSERTGVENRFLDHCSAGQPGYLYDHHAVFLFFGRICAGTEMGSLPV